MLQAIDQTDQQRRVLFVDDSRLMRYAGSKFLQGHCDLVLAEDGQQAWHALNQDKRIDLVFTDLMMPIMDGHALIQRIRHSTSSRIRQLPVLVVSGADESGARARALDAGASDFIMKPFSQQDLRHALSVDHHVAIPRRERPVPIMDPAESARIPATVTYPFHRPEEPAGYCHRLRQIISFHQRQQMELALLHVQFQGYGSTGDRFGRHWAEAVMRNLHRILTTELREEDSIHRTADDLFSIILMATSRANARELLQRLRRRLIGGSIQFSSMTLPVHVRFAVQFPDLLDDADPQLLLDEALQLILWRPDRVDSDRV